MLFRSAAAEQHAVFDVVDDIEDGMLLCRSQSEAPDIDPYVIVPVTDVSGYEIGQELDVVISDVHEYDLIGSLV